MAAKPPTPPDAFLSYTRFDNQHDGGAISEFCRRLASAVRAVTGVPFEIFQDVDDIDVGERWSGKLERVLDQARFFIPIMTPSYFKSGACRDELHKFLKAEKRTGRDDLVLPIYYIESAVLEDKTLREADQLAKILSSREHYDWRELRHSSFRNRKVRLSIDELARQIDRARQRVVSGSAATAPLESTAAVDKPAAPPAQQRSPEDLTIFKRRMATIRRSLGSEKDSGDRQHHTESFEPGTVFRDKDEPWCPELVVIPPGQFMMGSTETERQWAIEQGAERAWVEREKPQHLVRVAYPLAVGRYPVTFAEYGHFARTTGRAQPDDRSWGRGRRPVVHVDWDDAKFFIAWLSVQTGQSYRLLSEAEWEYACRAGTTTRYWWGDEITSENANYRENVGKTSEVGKHLANPFGLHDMHGNVWEWVEDCWNDSYERAPDDGRAWTTGDSGRRVLRGGSWASGPENLRSAFRSRNNTNERDYDVGFRVARTLSPRKGITS